jgi:cytochrome c oxidase assembly factor CtaG
MMSHRSPLTPLTLLMVGSAMVYLRGWWILRASPGSSVPLWRSLCFPFGLLLIWTATSSPLANLDAELLTAHMIQHLLLMTVAPFLILSSAPKIPLLQGLPVGLVRSVVGPVARSRFAHHVASLWGRLVLCWTISIGALILWHIPFLFDAAFKFELWHMVEHISFLVAGFLFWSPLFPSQASRQVSSWPLVLYFFLATLPCDILSGFLVFSDRVVYSVYLARPHFLGWSVLDDQQCAGALMWTCITILYLLPAAALTIRLLGAKHASSDDLVESGAN